MPRHRGLPHPPDTLPALVLITAWVLCSVLPPCEGASVFQLPTPNQALLESDGGERYFAPTPGRSWLAGTFGCVRSEGGQMHEGIDILATRRDRRGEPADPVLATAEGSVAYVNRRPGLSNYGNYIVLRHRCEGLEVFSLYAHLASIRPELRAGRRVVARERLGTMGRTTNTRSSIGKDRAHLHFEINLLLSDRFPAWLKQHYPGTRDDHGAWNGRNMAGLDPAAILRRAGQPGHSFSLLRFLGGQKAMMRALVADTDFPWLRRYSALVRPNPVARRQGVVGYELAFDYNGVPFAATPRARSEIEGSLTTRLLSVDADEHRRHPCRGLVVRRGQRWALTARGQDLLSLLTH